MKKIIIALKIVLISAVCSVLMYYLHKVNTLDGVDTLPLSMLAKHYGADIAVLLWGFTSYCVISIIFVMKGKYLTGSRFRKAFLYGGLNGGSWWIQMMELDQNRNNLIMGLVDGLVVVLVCLLVACIVMRGHRESEKCNDQINLHKGNKLYEKNEKENLILNRKKASDYTMEILIIAAVFALNRLVFGVFLGKYYNSTFDYLLIPIYSLYMGYMWIGLENMAVNKNRITKSLSYGIIVWGLPSAIFMYFLAFLFQGMLIGMTARNLFDMIFMSLGVWLALGYRERKVVR